MKYLMKCGHVNNAVNANKEPVCVICNCFDILNQCSSSDDLGDRSSRCIYCNKIEKSKWNLPFFKYTPQKEYDSHYCGCEGWE